ncbi:CopG family transcriptional regulator [Mangrovitalea sediminis]|uniref:CopG family transcriptional regulator n=1 Tax=Mangrovitalea sediminis TaxID=1982043 RepID=UPI000BE55077|nr:CopG family transcriptional regulator [Mangrovitalea sediminis]
MEKRTARLTLLIDPQKKAIFEEICTAHDLTASQVVRRMIREYIQAHGTPEQLARMPGMTGAAGDDAD